MADEFESLALTVLLNSSWNLCVQRDSPLHSGIYVLSLHWWRVMSCFVPHSALLPEALQSVGLRDVSAECILA